ncbi:MAG: GAF domain-containing protein [Acidobacteria bacterium]|nr:GAF domain-containing protein [Acidobacteriota bacterium]
MNKGRLLLVSYRRERELEKVLSSYEVVTASFASTLSLLSGSRFDFFIFVSEELSEKDLTLLSQVNEVAPFTFRLVRAPIPSPEVMLRLINELYISRFIPLSAPPSEVVSAIEGISKMGKRMRSELRKLEQRIKELNEIGIALSTEHNLKRLLSRILLEARRLTRAEAGSLYLVKGGKLSFEVAQNDYIERKMGKEAFRSITLPLEPSSIAGYVALTGEVLNIEDAYHLPPDKPYRFNQEVDKKIGYRSRSMLLVPMRNEKGEIMGVVQLINALDEKGEVVPFRWDYEPLVMSLTSQAAVAISNANLITEIKELLRSLVEYSASLIDARSAHTAGHTERVARYTLEIAQAINEEKEGPFASVSFSPDEMEELLFSAYLHDIGKIGVPEALLDRRMKLNEEEMEVIRLRFELAKSILKNQLLEKKVKGTPSSQLKDEKELEGKIAELDSAWGLINKVNKPSPLSGEDLRRLKEISLLRVDGLLPEGRLITDKELERLSVPSGNLTMDERRRMEDHVRTTINILSKIPFPSHLKRVPFIAGAHHERLDGSGYPQGLTAKDLPLPARVLAIADFYEALTAGDRPYKRALTREEALAILKEEADKGRLDQDVVRLIIRKDLLKRKQ